LQTSVATHQYTTHQLGSAQVAYRFHPLFGQEIQILRRLRAGSEPAVIAQGVEDLRIMIPCWMLDEVLCRGMGVESQPRVSVTSLAELRALIDAQNIQSGGVDGQCACVVANENNHESHAESSDPGVVHAPGDA
jgi:hypothetical protein